MFHSKASYSPMDKNTVKPHLNNINICEGVRTTTIKDKKLTRKYFTSQIFNIIIILIIVIFQVKTIKTIQKLEEKNIDIERKLFALETFINQTFAPYPPIWSPDVCRGGSRYGTEATRGSTNQPLSREDAPCDIQTTVINFHKIYHNIN